MELAKNMALTGIKFRDFAFSIRGKILLLTCGVAFFAAYIIGSVYAVRLTRQMDIERLANETRLIGTQIQSAFADMSYDALTSSRLPHLEAIPRSIKNKGIDPQDGTTTDQWRTRLNNIFTEILQSRHYYRQVRFIGIANNGHELARTVTTQTGIQSIPANQLQQRGNEPFFQESLNLERGSLHFSTVEKAKENLGQRGLQSHVIHTIAPVHNDAGTLLGLIVINADFEMLVSNVLSSILSNEDIYVISERGDYILRYADGKISPFFHHSTTPHPPEIVTRALALKRKTTFTMLGGDKEKTIIQTLKIPFDKRANNQDLTIAVAASENNLFGATRAAHRNSMLLAVALSIVAFFLAQIVARMFSRPLQQMNDEIQAYARGKHNLDLPVHLKDEIGQIARSFKDLCSWLDSSHASEKLAMARLQAIVDKSVDGIMTIDEKGTLINYNTGCVAIFGYTPEEVIGQNIKMLMPPHYADHHDGYLTRYRNTSQEHIIGSIREVEGMRKDGTAFPIELSVSRIDLEDGQRIFSGIVRDITARKEFEHRISRYNEALERSNKELDDFAYIASHDLKEPLRAISNHTNFLYEDHVAELDDDAKSRIDRIQKLCERSEKLVSELLYFSRLGRSELASQDVDINAVINQIREDFAALLEEKKASILVISPLPIQSCDHIRIVSVFQNLIVNAIKYNDSPEKIVEIGHLPTTTYNGQAFHNVYYVKDNGIGIAPEFSDHVFRLFKRLNPSRQYGDGTGAGLTFVKKIIERHGGRIWLESTPGQGSTFYFTLN